MSEPRMKERKHCRWCGKPYYASQPFGKDGFDSGACKMAHHRAYKKYVTATSAAAGDINDQGKRKK